MNPAYWFAAAQVELESENAPLKPEPLPPEDLDPPVIQVDHGKKISCPKCGKTGRGIVIHIRNCKG